MDSRAFEDLIKSYIKNKSDVYSDEFVENLTTSFEDADFPFNELHSSYDLQIMIALLHYYTMAVVTVGSLINIIALIVVVINRARYQFYAYLIGIIAGNLLFLLFLGVHSALKVNPVNIRTWFCKGLVYFMTATRHYPTLCLTVMSVERYVTVFHKRVMILVRNHRSAVKKRQTFIAVNLFLFCCVSNLWYCIAVKAKVGGFCELDTNLLSPVMINSLSVTNIVVVYFIPFSIMLICNICLLWRLFLLPLSNKASPKRLSLYNRFQLGIRSNLRPLLNNGIGVASTKMSSSTPSLASRKYKRYNSCIVMSRSLDTRLSKKKRATFALLVCTLTLDMVLNFPNHLLNIIDKYKNGQAISDLRTYQFVHSAVYILWHLQFLVTPLFMKLPFFKKTVRRDMNGSSEFHTVRHMAAGEEVVYRDISI